MKNPQIRRRKPKQARAKATIEAILQATAQIVERDGEAAFTTNRIAEKAGVSIGSLYQYFPNKKAILRALARRETRALYDATRRSGATDETEEFVLRLIGAFDGKPRLRQLVVKNWIAEVGALPLDKLDTGIDGTASVLELGAGLSPLDSYVLSRAVMGVVRAAVIEGSPDLHKPEFADAIVALIRSYRGTRARPAVRSRRSGSAGPLKARRARGRA